MRVIQSIVNSLVQVTIEALQSNQHWKQSMFTKTGAERVGVLSETAI